MINIAINVILLIVAVFLVWAITQVEELNRDTLRLVEEIRVREESVQKIALEAERHLNKSEKHINDAHVKLEEAKEIFRRAQELTKVSS